MKAWNIREKVEKTEEKRNGGKERRGKLWEVIIKRLMMIECKI